MVGEDEIKRRVIRIIAATRFPFVDQEDWPDDYVTVTNESQNRWGIVAPWGTVYPSIVILDGDDLLREVGEVETEETVTEAQVSKWRLLSERTGMGRRTKKFFLYVPEGKEPKAEKLLEENQIAYAGLRIWAIKDGSLVVTPIKTPDEPKDHR